MNLSNMNKVDLDEIELLREKYIPENLKVVFLGEPRPDSGSGKPRMFYLPYLSHHDNLFRGLMEALYDADAPSLMGRKEYWFKRFKSDGFDLLDAVSYPVNHLSQRERKAALVLNVELTANRIKKAKPSKGVIICHAGTYHVIGHKLQELSINILYTGQFHYL